MDISKYRDNVELSDIIVVVEDQEFNLHKFPLSINCEYFKSECKNQTKVILKEFFGGKANFEIVADHCYGKDVELTINNVASLLCSSEYLGMVGKGNLIEKCQKYIDRIIRSAEYSRSIDSVIAILESCNSLKNENLKSVIDRGLAIIIQLWLRPLSSYKSNLKENFIEDSIVFESILNLGSDWIEKIIENCSVDETKFPYLAKLVVTYIETQIINKEIKDQSGIKEVKNNDESSSNNDFHEFQDDEANLSDSKKLKIKTKNKSSTSAKDKRENFDRIINALPDDLGLGKIVTVGWLQQALDYCKKYECRTKSKLMKVCGGMLTHTSMKDLGSMDPTSVTEMIDQALNNDKVDKEFMKWIWDHHFLEMAQNSELDPAIFRKVVQNMPESQDIDPDVVFKIVLSILNNIGSDGEKYKDELINSVDMERISPENLEVAMESKFWDASAVCKVAIKRLKDKENYKSYNKYSFKDTKGIHDEPGDDHIDTSGSYPTRNLSSFRNHSYSSHLHSFPNPYDEIAYTSYPDIHHNYYPTSKYVYSSYCPETYVALEENLKCELKRISDSYADYYRSRLRSRSRRKHPITYHY